MVAKEWVTFTEAQKIYSLSKPTLRKLVKEGEIVASRPVVKKILLKKRSIDEYLERKTIGDGAEIENLFKKIINEYE